MSCKPRHFRPPLVAAFRAKCPLIGCSGVLGAPKAGFSFRPELKLPRGGKTRRCEKCGTHVYLESMYA